MELLIISSQELLNKQQVEILKTRFTSIKFIENKDIENYDYNKNSDKKILLLDPDYFDWNLPKGFFEKINDLKYVCLTTTTASYVDEDYLKKNNIELLTIPKYSTDSVAEYLVFLMFCLAKKLPLQLKNNKKQEFTDMYLQMELTGKKVGVVGLGNIGNRVCEICSGIGMEVEYWNRTSKISRFKKSSLENIFKNSDVVFITLANNSETRQLISNVLLNSLKETAILISNTGVVLHNDKIVRDKIKNGKLFGFGAELPCGSYEEYDGNVMITSEYAWFTKEATQRRIDILLENLLSIK